MIAKREGGEVNLLAEDELHPLQVTTEQLQHQLHMVLAKQDDMENSLRRCNLRFVGIPEGSGGTDPSPPIS